MNTFLNQVIKTAREFPFLSDEEVVRIANTRSARELNQPYQRGNGIFDDLLMTGQVKVVDGKMVKNRSTLKELENNAWKRLETMLDEVTSDALKLLWDNLDNYDPNDSYDSVISMDEYAQAVYSEMSKRGIKA